MSFIIVGKAAVASIGLCLVAMSGLYVVSPATIDNWMAPLYSAEVYGFLTDTTQTTTSTAGTTITSKKLKCQIETAAKFDCTVYEVDKLTDITKNSKKHISLKEFSTSQSSKAVTSSLAPKKLYKITSSELHVDYQDWKTKPIKVFDSGSTTTELGSITSMFMTRGRTKTLAGKTMSFIGQASKELSTTNKKYKCSWSAESKDFKECQVFSFSKDDDAEPTPTEKDDISKLTFESSATEASEIKKNHYYLIQFTKESDVTQTLEKFDKTTLVYVEDGSSTPPAVNTIVTFNKLSAVTVVGDKLLILK